MKKTLCLFTALLLVMSCISCAKKNSTTVSAKDSDIYGKVTNVRNSVISFNVLTFPGMEGFSKDNILKGKEWSKGEPPEMPDGGEWENKDRPEDSRAKDQGEEVPKQPDGTKKPGIKKQDGKRPDMSGFDFGLTETGENGTLTVTDASVLYIVKDQNEAKASLEDVSTGMIVRIAFDSKGKITKITIGEESDLMYGFTGFDFRPNEAEKPKG